MPMRLALILALSLAAAPAWAQVSLGGRACATPDPTIAETLESMAIVRRFQLREPALRLQDAGPVTVPVAFHVVTDGSGGGEVPTARLEAQLDTLNSAFARFDVRFALALVQRVENADWYRDLRLGSAEERALKGELGLDPARVLNVYTADLASDFLGWASPPYEGSESDADDGVVLLDQALPGGDAVPYNLGHTGTHEVGHWLGLAHTFAGGCSEPNDGVADTPQERSPASGCPTTRDSCPLDPGTDPVRNYMDYSADACMTEFTAGQVTRSRALVERFRPTVAAGGYGLATVPLADVSQAFVGVPSPAVLRVTNATGAPFAVTGVGSDGLDVSATGLPVEVAPGGVAVIPLAVGVHQPGAFAETVRVTTTSAQAGTLAVGLRGTATLPPTARLRTDAAGGTAVGGATVEQAVTLANDGDGPLVWRVDADRLPAWVASVSPASGTVPPRGQTELSFVLVSGTLTPSDYAASVVIETNDPVNGDLSVGAGVLLRPAALGLRPVYPNPSAGVVAIPLELPAEAAVTVEVFDLRGRRVATVARDRTLPVGYPELRWSTAGLASGVYVVRVRAGAEEATATLTVAR